MDHPQIIHSPKGEEMVLLSRKDYDRLAFLAHANSGRTEDEEDAEDVALALAEIGKIKKGQTTLIPAEVVHAIVVDRVHPVKAWRDHYGWTSEVLAKKAKLTRTTISQIETGKRKGTVAVFKALAKALGINVTCLID